MLRNHMCVQFCSSLRRTRKSTHPCRKTASRNANCLKHYAGITLFHSTWLTKHGPVSLDTILELLVRSDRPRRGLFVWTDSVPISLVSQVVVPPLLLAIITSINSLQPSLSAIVISRPKTLTVNPSAPTSRCFRKRERHEFADRGKVCTLKNGTKRNMECRERGGEKK